MGDQAHTPGQSGLDELERRQRALLTRLERRRRPGAERPGTETSLRERLSQAEAERDAARRAWADEVLETEKIRRRLVDADRDLDRSIKKERALQRRVNKVLAREETRKTERESLRNDLARVRSELSGVQSELTEARTESARIQADAAQTQDELIRAQDELTKSRGELEELRRELADTAGAHQERVEKLKSELTQAQDELNKTQEELTRTREELTTAQMLEAELVRTRTELHQFHEQAGEHQRLQSELEAARGDLASAEEILSALAVDRDQQQPVEGDRPVGEEEVRERERRIAAENRAAELQGGLNERTRQVERLKAEREALLGEYRAIVEQGESLRAGRNR
jgi:chromosome segregation ATPase